MNILICNWRDITHPWSGGAERHLHELAKNWSINGHKVTLLTSSYPGASNLDKIEGVKIIRSGNSYLSFLHLPLYLLFRIDLKDFDCVIDTAHGVPFFLPLVTRKPVVLIIHHDHKKLWQTEFNKYVSSVGIFLEQYLVPIIYKNCQIVTLSESEKKHLLEKGYKRVTAIPPGIDTNFFRPGQKKFHHPTILYLGRLRKYKRVEILLEIWPLLKKKIPNLELIIAGAGQDKSRLERIVRSRKLEGVTFKGFVSEKEKKELLQKSWVLAFTSLMEGWGLVSMEAAACGTPTVGFRVPGVMDAVSDGESGMLASNKNDFLEALLSILEDRKLRLRLSIGSIKWASRFNWKNSADRFMAKLGNQKIEERYNKRYFTSIWRSGYKRKFKPVYSFRIWYIKKYLRPNKLLDVGYGSGIIALSLLSSGVDVKGVDVSKSALSLIPSRFKNRFSIGDAKKLKYKTDSFDTVICIDVLEHIDFKDLSKVIRECARVARKQIYFDITSLEDILFIFSDKTHISKFFSWTWKDILSKNLGAEWKLQRGPILPGIHHAIFIAKRK